MLKHFPRYDKSITIKPEEFLSPEEPKAEFWTHTKNWMMLQKHQRAGDDCFNCLR